MTSYMCNIDAERYPDLLCTKIRHIVSKHLFQFYSLGTLVLLHDTQNPWNLLEIYIIGMLPASVAQLDALSNWKPGGRGFNPRRGRQHSFVEIDHEIFSTVILSLPLVQERHLSVFGERMRTILVNRLED